jgi:hypothetical protein
MVGYNCIHFSISLFKGIQAVRIDFFYLLKVANIRCFILNAVEIFHNIIHRLSEFFFLNLLKVANIRCFIPIAVEIFHNIIRK